jgi:hypothetical protein
MQLEQAKGGNFYMCPEYWCPISEVPMSREEVENKNGICVSGEKPFCRPRLFWAMERQGHPLAPEKHPLGYTLLQKNMKNMMMARIKKCGTLDNVPRMILEKTAIVHQEEDNMRYIMSSTSFPYL